MSKIVNKPWGREIWAQVNKKYVVKIIELKKGIRLKKKLML